MDEKVIMAADGIGGSRLELIEVEEGYSKIRIKHRGFWNALASGWVGEKDILVSHISSIAWAPSRGRIQFSFLGSDDSLPVALVNFDDTQEKAFEEIKKAIEQKMAECSSKITADTRLCPYCAEVIKKAAIVCKHCGRDVAPSQGAARPPS
jgi:hypothetical protein